MLFIGGGFPFHQCRHPWSVYLLVHFCGDRKPGLMTGNFPTFHSYELSHRLSRKICFHCGSTGVRRKGFDEAAMHIVTERAIIICRFTWYNGPTNISRYTAEHGNKKETDATCHLSDNQGKNIWDKTCREKHVNHIISAFPTRFIMQPFLMCVLSVFIFAWPELIVLSVQRYFSSANFAHCNILAVEERHRFWLCYIRTYLHGCQGLKSIPANIRREVVQTCYSSIPKWLFAYRGPWKQICVFMRILHEHKIFFFHIRDICVVVLSSILLVF